jgi:hypothetical protein
MITFDAEQFAFAPIRRVYTFRLTLTERFAADSLRLTAAERSFLEPRLAIGKPWPTVTAVIEDWRSHVVLKVDEGDPYSMATRTVADRSCAAFAFMLMILPSLTRTVADRNGLAEVMVITATFWSAIERGGDSHSARTLPVGLSGGQN